MITKDELLALMREGITAEDLAEQFSNALNDAESTRQEEVIKANAEKLEAERVYEAKREAVYVMLDGLSDYLLAAGEEELQRDIAATEVSKVIEMLDSAIDMAKSLDRLRNLEFDKNSGWISLFNTMFD